MVIHGESRLWRGGGGVVKDEMKIKFLRLNRSFPGREVLSSQRERTSNREDLKVAENKHIL